MRESAQVEGRLPDRETEHGRAWRAQLGDRHRASGTTSAWVVYAPWAHPFWANYAIAVCHLRPMPGVPEPKLHFPEATHQMLLVALDPDVPPRLDDPMSTALRPSNFAAQWVAASDLDADDKIERCVEEILAGALSPDTDFTREWIKRFNASMVL